MSKICINCYFDNSEELDLCSNCGAELPIIGDLSTDKVDEAPSGKEEDITSIMPEYSIDDPKIGLFILSHQMTIPLEEGKEYLIGRIEEENTGSFKNIDLSPYDGFDKGVSRVHATIQLDEDGIHLVDLDSSNNTYLNEFKLTPRRKFSLTHGDTVRFGAFKLMGRRLPPICRR